MRDILRPLLPTIATALACMTALVLCIRAEPLATPRALQLALSVGLIAALAILVALVLRAEREDEPDRASAE